ncbi:MAG: glycosyltransferase family 4 protein, partial [Methyloceanibacter sp.]
MVARVLYVVTEDWYFLSHRLPMARAAKEAGYEVHVATRLKDGEAAIKREGFVPHALPWIRGSFSPRGSVQAIFEIRRLLRELDPDILHNVSLKPVLLGTTASLGFGETAVVNSLTGLGTLFIGDTTVSGVTRRLVRYTLAGLLRRRRSKTVVQNPEDWDFVLDLGVPPEDIVLIPGSGVDTEYFTPQPEPPPPITAAYVGRMLADKGVVTLISAVSLLAERGAPLQLLLAGDCDRENPGSLAPEQLREFASLYGIHWLGHVADIRKVWAMAHFAVLASRREGLPKSLLEAAACGRAMVATDA